MSANNRSKIPVPIKKANNSVPSRPRSNMMKRPDTIVSNTPTGAGFLKCAFAAPDFAAENNAGIPDTYSGKTIVKSHRLTGTMSMTASTDAYILVLPTPGIAFWTCSVASGTAPTQTTVWTGQKFGDTSALFPTSTMNTNFTQFRMVSNIMELKCTSNATQWSGSITCWKFPTTFNVVGQTVLSANQTNLYEISGLQNANLPPGVCYSTTQNMGIYAPCYHLTEEFLFKPIISNMYVNRYDSETYGYLDLPTPGYDSDMEAMCIRISASTSNFITKNWQCVEYQANVNSAIYDYARISAPRDEKALRCYHEFTRQCQLAYTSFENDNMWERVLKYFLQATSAAAYLPGPYGAIAGGLNAMGSGIQTLML